MIAVAVADAPVRTFPHRPRLRGWIHLWSFAISLAACATLIAVASTVSARAAVATAVYGATVLGMFGISSLYHRRTWRKPGSRLLMRRLDHSMIFVFIAGTYTPAALLAMGEPVGPIVLAVVWSGCLVGVAIKMIWPLAPRWIGVPIYLALGWVAAFVLPELVRGTGVATLVLLLVGGAIYTVGAVGFALRWPRGWPHTFGYHEFFHAATALAASCHYVAIWLIVLH